MKRTAIPVWSRTAIHEKVSTELLDESLRGLLLGDHLGEQLRDPLQGLGEPSSLVGSGGGYQ
jgi:hypothetical protein